MYYFFIRRSNADEPCVALNCPALQLLAAHEAKSIFDNVWCWNVNFWVSDSPCKSWYLGYAAIPIPYKWKLKCYVHPESGGNQTWSFLLRCGCCPCPSRNDMALAFHKQTSQTAVFRRCDLSSWGRCAGPCQARSHGAHGCKLHFLLSYGLHLLHIHQWLLGKAVASRTPTKVPFRLRPSAQPFIPSRLGNTEKAELTWIDKAVAQNYWTRQMDLPILNVTILGIQ